MLSQPPQLDYNEKCCGLGPPSPYGGHPIPTKIHSAEKTVTRINTPRDEHSYLNQHHGSSFSCLPTLESSQSCSGSSTASYSPTPSVKGGLLRTADIAPRGLSTYGRQDVLRAAERHDYDSEKQSLSTSNFRAPTPRARAAAAIYNQGALIVEESDPEDHALWILIYLSVLSPLASILISLYTLVAILLLIILSSFCFCTSRANFSSQLIRYLAPPLDTQLGLICSPITPDSHKTSMLVLINLLSPTYALGIAISAWIAAAFWGYAAILGDPDGRDSKNDGVVAVMWVRWWWEVWLKRAVR